MFQINDKGLFNVDKASELSQKFLAETDDQQKATEVIKTCSSSKKTFNKSKNKNKNICFLLIWCLQIHKNVN